MSEKRDGRNHNPTGFTMWIAGDGVRSGYAYGTTDKVGLHTMGIRLHVHDLHSTILHLMGLDYRELVYLHKSRPDSIDQKEGRAFKQGASLQDHARCEAHRKWHKHRSGRRGNARSGQHF